MKLQLEIRTTTQTPINKRQIQRFVECVQGESPFPQGYNLSVALVGEQRMAHVNGQYRHAPHATNVLSFGLDAKNGEIVLCPQVIKRQAKAKKVSFSHELLYLLSHGILHLQGFDHEGSEAQAQHMERKEQQILSVCFL